ncbi:alpha/beta hydrolase family protein [Pedobacter alpinus]|uniref:Alpha/beta hydrolase family protein n=2 Tax=Pedobacter alpinus TaxID=1590643 RepID=A0ABW5TNB2_9SPHI
MEIQERYQVAIKFDEKQVTGKTVDYALWRFRPDVDETLENILKPLDMKVNKEKEGVYKLKDYEYYRWQPEDGWAELARLASKYNDKAGFEKRKAALIPCIMEALQLSPLPPKPNSKPIFTAVRKFDGYTVQNMALEVMPGVYLSGSLYRPSKMKGKIPLILSPDGHWLQQRYRKDCQIRCATLARMGAMAFSYDLFAWGESMLQFEYEDHRKSLSMAVQTLDAIRLLDYFLTRKDVDPERVGISGGSGAGSHTVLITAIDDRIKLSAPAVAISSYFYGGCPCESGLPIHLCGGGTNNVELAAFAAPKPQLLISDGGDWTAHTPLHDFPYLQNIYSYYGAKDKIENVHLPTESHDYGVNKRKALYDFVARNFSMNINAINEDKVSIETENDLKVFGDKGEKLPSNAMKGYAQLENYFKKLDDVK